LPHIFKRYRRACRAQHRGMTGWAMAGPVKTEHHHPGRAGSGDAGDTVFDRDAALRSRFHLSGGEQKKIGRRLAVLDLQGGENVRRKPIVKASAAEGDPHALRRSAGGDANRLRDRIKHGVDMRDGVQIGFEGAEQFVLQLRVKVIG